MYQHEKIKPEDRVVVYRVVGGIGRAALDTVTPIENCYTAELAQERAQQYSDRDGFIQYELEGDADSSVFMMNVYGTGPRRTDRPIEIGQLSLIDPNDV